MAHTQLRILHLDDDAAFVDLVATMLEAECGHLRVETAVDPVACIRSLRAPDVDIDCIVCDFEMPVLDGLDVYAFVQEVHPDIPFILYTGKESTTLERRAYERGVDAFVQKSIQGNPYETLAGTIESLVETQHSPAIRESSDQDHSLDVGV